MSSVPGTWHRNNLCTYVRPFLPLSLGLISNHYYHTQLLEIYIFLYQSLLQTASHIPIVLTFSINTEIINTTGIMVPALSSLSFLILLFPLLVSAACTDNSTDTAGLQKLLTDGSAGYKLQLCQNQIYSLTNTLNYTASNQVCLNYSLLVDHTSVFC